MRVSRENLSKESPTHVENRTCGFAVGVTSWQIDESTSYTRYHYFYSLIFFTNNFLTSIFGVDCAANRLYAGYVLERFSKLAIFVTRLNFILQKKKKILQVSISILNRRCSTIIILILIIMTYKYIYNWLRVNNINSVNNSKIFPKISAKGSQKRNGEIKWWIWCERVLLVRQVWKIN